MKSEVRLVVQQKMKGRWQDLQGWSYGGGEKRLGLSDLRGLRQRNQPIEFRLIRREATIKEAVVKE